MQKPLNELQCKILKKIGFWFLTTNFSKKFESNTFKKIFYFFNENDLKICDIYWKAIFMYQNINHIKFCPLREN